MLLRNADSVVFYGKNEVSRLVFGLQMNVGLDFAIFHGVVHEVVEDVRQVEFVGKNDAFLSE